MRHSSFSRELCDAVAADFSLLFISLSAFAAMGENHRLEAIVLVELLLFPAIIALGFLAGERCFPASFSERYLFLGNLPVNRGGAWREIIAARLIAVVGCVGAGASSVVWLAPKLRFTPPAFSVLLGGYSGAFLLFLSAFFAGGIFSLLIQRKVLVYIVGLSVTELAFLGVHLFVRICISRLTDRIGALDLDAFSRYRLVISSILLALLIVISFFAFLNYEVFSSRCRLRGLVSVALLVMPFAATLLLYWLSPTFSSLFSGWVPIAYQFPYGLIHTSIPRLRSGAPTTMLGLVSGDGRYVAIPEYLRDRPWFSRVTLVDSRNGVIVSRSTYRGLVDMHWLAFASRYGRQQYLSLITREVDSSSFRNAGQSAKLKDNIIDSDGRILTSRSGPVEELRGKWLGFHSYRRFERAEGGPVLSGFWRLLDDSTVFVIDSIGDRPAETTRPSEFSLALCQTCLITSKQSAKAI